MQNTIQFYQKNALVTIMIARDIMNKKPGDKMISIAEYEKNCGFSRWTIQTAIKALLDHKCMQIEKCGPKGSFLEWIDYEKLWPFTDWDPLLGCLPVSTSDTLSGLLTGLNTVLKKKEIPFNLSFMTPVKNRLDSLENARCNFVVTTRMAYEISKDKYKNIEVALELTGCKYNLGYSIYNHEKNFKGIEDGMSIGIYTSALEQTYLSNLICEGKDIKKVYMPYHETYSAFVHKKVDLVVQRDDCLDYKDYMENRVSLSSLGLDDKITTPVVLVNKNDHGIDKLIQNNIDVSEIMRLQQDVMNGRMDPSYY